MEIEKIIHPLLWEFLNSTFLQSGITGIVGVFAYKAAANTARTAANSDEVVAAQETNKFEKQAEKAANETPKQELPEDLPKNGNFGGEPASVETASESFRTETRDLVLKAKGYLDQRVSSETDGRYKRTYAYIGKDYPPLAAALHERKRINIEQFNAFVEIFKIWNSYERGYAANKPVPKSVYEHVMKIYKIAIPS
jgi:hypothetical protein